MNPIEQLAKIFKIKKSEINDNLMNTTISKIIEFSQIPTYEEINNALEKFNKRDHVEIYLKDESEESITIASNKNNIENYKNFINNLELICLKPIALHLLNLFHIKSYFSQTKNCARIYPKHIFSNFKVHLHHL